jgi:beta-glucosidase
MTECHAEIELLFSSLNPIPIRKDGYIVTMAPPQSYLNINNQNFSRFLNLTYPTRTWHPEFHYFGSNVYAYILAKYGEFIDLVSIQLYESYSDAAMAVYHGHTSAEKYLFDYIQGLANQHFQFYVDFSQDTLLNMQGQFVPLPLDKLVIGLANGWALNKVNKEKVLYISADQCKDAYDKSQESPDGDLAPRGFMLWTMEERGVNDVYLAKGLGNFLDGSEC